jgi:WD40 repeat protein
MALSLDGALRIWQLPDPDDKVEPYLSTDAGIAELERRAGIAETSADGHAPPAAAGDSPPARLSRDGRRKLTVTADGDVQVWNTTTGAAIGPPLQHAREIVAADLSRDGRRIAIGLVNRSLKLYDADTGDPLGASIPLSVTPSPRGLWFADDDRSLLLRSRDGGWHQYRLPQLDLPQDQVGLLLNLLTGEQIDEGTQRILMLPRDTFQQAPTSYLQIWRRWRGLD